MQNSIERVSVRSALNPLLWLCGLVSGPAAIGSAFVTQPSLALQVLALAPVAVTLFAYLYLMFKDPDRLQSESFQLRKQALELIEEKGSLEVISSASIEVISNPDLPALLPRPGDQA